MGRSDRESPHRRVERVPFQRVLRAHLHGLDALRTRGLLWQSLVHLLLRAGVQRPQGRPYSADYLRVCANRLQFAPVDGRISAPALPWRWDGGPAQILSRATDQTGYVQPARATLVSVRGTQSFYHNNAMFGWAVAADGGVSHAG
ncbi:hypothetical protein ASF32_23015 [Methylobacterium sp. Leaf91]|nr:hypothetical protein ASF32_23015 [Methylobacterium sp. Leaf91]